MNLKRIGKIFTSKFVGTGPSFYKRRIYRSAVLLWLRNTDMEEPISVVVNNIILARDTVKCRGLLQRTISTVLTEL